MSKAWSLDNNSSKEINTKSFYWNNEITLKHQADYSKYARDVSNSNHKYSNKYTRFYLRISASFSFNYKYISFDVNCYFQLFTKTDGTKMDVHLQRAPHSLSNSISFFYFLYHPAFVRSLFKTELVDVTKDCGGKLAKYDEIFHIQ